jgi:nitrate reductase gamma subunit
MKFEENSMVNWKIALIVVIIVVLVMAVGMWFGYRFVSEQDDISPEGWRKRSNTTDSYLDKLLVFAPIPASVSQE